MRPLGIVIQLDELEYFLPGLYPGVALAIEGKLPFQGLEERLHDGVVARAPLRENDWANPRSSSSLLTPGAPHAFLTLIPCSPVLTNSNLTLGLASRRPGIFLASRPPCGAPRSPS